MGILLESQEDDFIALYRDYMDTKNKATKDYVDQKRIARLTPLVNKRFRDIGQKKALSMLFHAGLIDRQLLDILDVFDKDGTCTIVGDIV
jgi:hypothetical protein